MFVLLGGGLAREGLDLVVCEESRVSSLGIITLGSDGAAQEYPSLTPCFVHHDRDYIVIL